MSEKNLLTLSETAHILGLSLTTIRRWSANSRLPTIHFSKRTVRVTRDVINSIIKNGLPVNSAREEKIDEYY
jgi:predicted site-specific integrase-resolvase